MYVRTDGHTLALKDKYNLTQRQSHEDRSAHTEWLNRQDKSRNVEESHTDISMYTQIASLSKVTHVQVPMISLA